MKQFLELGGGVAVTGVFFGIGVLARIVLLGYYGLLGQACKRLDSTKNRTVRYLRDELKRRLETGTEIKSVASYTENCMIERRIAGIRIGAWESSRIQSVLLAMLTGAVCSLGGVLWECDGKRILEMLFAAGGSAVVLMVLDMMFGLEEKHKRTRLCIREHIENAWLTGTGITEAKVDAAPVHNKKEDTKAAKKAQKESRRSAKRVKQKSATKKHGKAQEEKRRLTEELLRERRQMEARQFTERKKEVTEEVAATQTAGEILQELVTLEESQKEDLSYESLLRNVLAEYLA